MAKETAGMDEAQAQKDRGGWSTEVVNITGGQQKDIEAEAGIEVGNPYDKDPLGQKKSG